MLSTPSFKHKLNKVAFTTGYSDNSQADIQFEDFEGLVCNPKVIQREIKVRVIGFPERASRE